MLGRRIKGVQGACDTCARFKLRSPATSSPATVAGDAAGDDTFRLVAPIGTNQVFGGIGAKKPWAYQSTAVIPHLNTPENLPVLIGLLRLQTAAPYICIIDTGSPPAVRDKIERLRSDDVEIHYILANGYCHSSEPVCVAIDVGMARANTPMIFLTHTDCFPTCRGAVAYLADQVSQLCPVVGWEMSDRSWLTDQWRGMVSHTFTMLHASTMRRIGATWHMGRAREQLGGDAGYQSAGWPDTETGFAYCLRAAGITPRLLGHELNYVRQTTEWWDHSRSLTGSVVYGADGEQARSAREAARAVLHDAEARLAEWQLKS